MLLESTITCPSCGHAKSETMPTDACQFFYECANCGALLRPNSGDCCVFCSFGSVPCPPIQAQRAGSPEATPLAAPNARACEWTCTCGSSASSPAL
jgi:hypothetical protein